MTKKEKWYLEYIPSDKELTEEIKTNLKLKKEIEENIKKAPAVLKPQFEKQLDKTNKRIEWYKFALDCYIRGYIEGKHKGLSPEEKLVEVLFDDDK